MNPQAAFLVVAPQLFTLMVAPPHAPPAAPESTSGNHAVAASTSSRLKPDRGGERVGARLSAVEAEICDLIRSHLVNANDADDLDEEIDQLLNNDRLIILRRVLFSESTQDESVVVANLAEIRAHLADVALADEFVRMFTASADLARTLEKRTTDAKLASDGGATVPAPPPDLVDLFERPSRYMREPQYPTEVKRGLLGRDIAWICERALQYSQTWQLKSEIVRALVVRYNENLLAFLGLARWAYDVEIDPVVVPKKFDWNALVAAHREGLTTCVRTVVLVQQTHRIEHYVGDGDLA